MKYQRILSKWLLVALHPGANFILVLLCLSFAGCGGQKETGAVPPNIIFILADDLGVPQVGCYGSDYYRTPCIDSLARSGMRFTNAYAASAVCSPTRASIMTGKYPARLHITDFIPRFDTQTHDQLIPPVWQKFLPLNETTIAEALKELGYTTAHFGKWHLSRKKAPPVSLEHNPDKQGFDEHFITYKPSDYMPLGSWQTQGSDAHSVDTITCRAIDFIRRHREDPFFLMVSHNSIHRPLVEDQKLIAKYAAMAGAEKEEHNPVIAAMMETLDESIGRIIREVTQTGISERTLILFFSDNGGLRKDAKQTPFREGKGWLYEGGIRVPLIVSWPGRVQSGTVEDCMVSSIDLFPTFLEVAGDTGSWEDKVDGISILPVLLETGTIDRQTLYWHYPHYHRGSGMRPGSAIHVGSYKLVRWYEPEMMEGTVQAELYDLKTDPGEQYDLADSLPQRADLLLNKLDQWIVEVGAQLPVSNQ